MKTLLIITLLLTCSTGYSQSMVTNYVTKTNHYLNISTGELSSKVVVTTNVTQRYKLSDISKKDNTVITKISTNEASTKLTKIDMSPRDSTTGLKDAGAGASSTINTHYNVGGVRFTRTYNSKSGKTRWR